MTIVLDEQTILDQLLRSPRLPMVARKIEKVLADEAAQRQAFYAQITEGDKVEYINGEIIFHSPVKLRHNTASGHLYRLLSTFVMLYDEGYVGYEKLLIALTRNDYEPDICYFNEAKSAHFSADQMKFPAPDFAVEVLSDSTAANDRGVKFQDYADHGVQEYWIIDPTAETLEQYRLVAGRYDLMMKSGSGEVTSIVLPQFQIPVRAIFDDLVNRDTLRTILSAA
ncbi:MAG: Uma2 family endonuclease [Caldilineaceae bacterium]